MRIETPAEKMLYCTIRLEVEKPALARTEAGTAFIFTVSRESESYPFLVTNKHVVGGAQTGRFFFTEAKDGKPSVGTRLDVEMHNFEAQWYGHPDPHIDVAAMPLGPLVHLAADAGKHPFFTQITESFIPTPEELQELDALEEVTFVGYPNGLYDNVNLLPVFRRGVTATPLNIDYLGKPVFLLDASVVKGSSGSPVLIYNLGSYPTRSGLRTGTRLFFLGLIARVYTRAEEATLRVSSTPTAVKPVITTDVPINLGVVFKASAVLETVQGLLSTLDL